MPETRSLHRNTPSLVVYDPRNLVVRQVAYHRATAPVPAQRRITFTRLAANVQWQRQWDPRLFESDSAQPSQQTLASLSGRTLSSESRDAGWTLSLPGEAGETSETWDTRGNHWRTDYDELRRPVLIHETAAGQPRRVAERFTWSTVAGSNRRGRLVRHDDEAGTRLIKGYSLTGAEQEETRYLLPTLALPDWPETLDPDSAANSTLRHSPLGEVLERSDALGNRERSRFNLSGELAGSSLILADGTECLLLTDTRYNAFGQIESQTAGNGVISYAEYDPADGRLARLSSNRPGRSKLQDLHYAYDPVGNVIRIEDRSQPVRHFANQRVDPVSTFAYDSLYQLTEAKGREATGATIGPALPDLAPDPGDTSRLLNYRQLYEYDASGNLLSLQHIGQQPYTRVMNVAEDSNRAVPEPGNPLASFDANGNLRQLSAGQPLQWNARNQLHSTRQVTRDDGDSDEEHYRYGGDGLRVRKVVTRRVSGRMQASEVRYLPGLELHTRQGESFAVITTQAGRCAVRCLIWSEGQPGGIANPQLRYSLDDLHDSSGLELDDAANIISHEGYYPFGGTAWWAANSAIEASYKTRRYSGKERDSTGLYYYGLRYYAPWLMRWINPDPGGDIDGLNRYRMVRNNPMTLKDPDGRSPIDALDALDLAVPIVDRTRLAEAYLQVNPTLERRRSDFSEMTQEMLSTARRNSQELKRMKDKQKQRFLKEHPGLLTEPAVKAFAAHAGVMLDDDVFETGFTNLSGSLSPRNPYPGVLLIQRKSSLTLAPIPGEPRKHLGYYLVSDTNAMLKAIRASYQESSTTLHPYTEQRIREHIEESNFRIPIHAGIPGLHAEVRAMNSILHRTEPDVLQSTIARGFVFTERLIKAPGKEPGSDFPACYNCSGILPPIVTVVTGRVSPERYSPERTRSTSPPKHKLLR